MDKYGVFVAVILVVTQRFKGSNFESAVRPRTHALHSGQTCCAGAVPAKTAAPKCKYLSRIYEILTKALYATYAQII